MTYSPLAACKKHDRRRDCTQTDQYPFTPVQYKLVVVMHDHAACNDVALRTLKVVFPTIVNVGCFSHTLDLVGEKLSLLVSPRLWSGGSVCLAIVQSRCCFGRRELANSIGNTRQLSGGASLKS